MNWESLAYMTLLMVFILACMLLPPFLGAAPRTDP